MADPVEIACPADVWTPVALSVNTGVVHIKDRAPGKYLHTYRTAGVAAPTDKDDAIPFEILAVISSSFPIDVYIFPVDKAGAVLVALS